MDLNYEKLGVFYLGKGYDLHGHRLLDDLILYDAKDLTTHGVIIGMTGSGKTGLGIGIIEEALMDNIPVIAIDPKGDLPNLKLLFPDLTPADFLPWVNRQDAVRKGMTPETFAQETADSWRTGLLNWQQGPERIRRLKENIEITVYTPGSSAGKPVNVLRNFSPPSPNIMNDTDLLRDRIQGTCSGILSLIGLDAYPLTGREHILLANIFEKTWSANQTLDLGSLIHAIQQPPFTRIGVFDLELFYPAKDRFSLAMRLNNLLAAPGFETWMSGEPLDIQKLLFAVSGKPRASIFSINHLSHAERMYFVTTLLNEIVSWMRSQQGTTSLRALLYMDEIFGFFPPVQNPPSKLPLMTLLKQARAYGLGVVLSTQNPVDLDYKGLSNAGTWFIGRLQTETDKERVLSGMESVTSGVSFDRKQADMMLSGLGKRVFYLHNVHENEPAIFQTRWVMSYLSGPMTREQLKLLTQDETHSQAPAAKDSQQIKKLARQDFESSSGSPAETPPVIPPGVETYYYKYSGAGHGQVYVPSVLGKMEIRYTNSRHNIDAIRDLSVASELSDGPVPCNWDDAFEIELNVQDLSEDAPRGVQYMTLPSAAHDPKVFVNWQRDLKRWVSYNRPLKLYRSKPFAMTSAPNEDEGAFRARLSLAAREKRDMEMENLRLKYSNKFNALKDQILHAEQAVAREQEQSKGQKMRTVISFGTALLGAFLGRKTVSGTSASKIGTAMKSASRMQKEKMDIERARERLESKRKQLETLEIEFQNEIKQVEDIFNPATVDVEVIEIKPKQSDVNIELFGLTWMPYRREAGGGIHADFNCVRTQTS